MLRDEYISLEPFHDTNFFCSVCRHDIPHELRHLYLDPNNDPHGWQCAHCQSIFNMRDEIVEVGGVYEIGEA